MQRQLLKLSMNISLRIEWAFIMFTCNKIPFTVHLTYTHMTRTPHLISIVLIQHSTRCENFSLVFIIMIFALVKINFSYHISCCLMPQASVGWTKKNSWTLVKTNETWIFLLISYNINLFKWDEHRKNVRKVFHFSFIWW